MAKARKKIKYTTIESLIDFLEMIKKYKGMAMYRGHRDEKWQLIPRIGRDMGTLTYWGGWDGLEEGIYDEFRKYALPYLSPEPKNIVEWLVIGQHHGLPTRLLDWSTNPLVGLFFAVSGESKGIDSAVWGIDPSFWIEELHTLDAIDNIETFYPPHLDPRLIAQQGCFTIHPFPKDKLPTFRSNSARIEIMLITFPFLVKSAIGNPFLAHIATHIW